MTKQSKERRLSEIKGPSLVRQLVREIEGRGLTIFGFPQSLGFSEKIIAAWAAGTANAKLCSIEAMWNALGYELIAVPRGGDLAPAQRERDAALVEQAARRPRGRVDGALVALAQRIRGGV